MSQLRLYLDEDAQRKALVQALCNAEIDTITTTEAGNIACSDKEQLIWATAQARIIYSLNMKDFCRLHKVYVEQRREHAGIVVAERQSYSIGEQLRGLLRLIETKSTEEMRNQLIFLGAYIRMT